MFALRENVSIKNKRVETMSYRIGKIEVDVMYALLVLNRRYSIVYQMRVDKNVIDS
jgi:hypothetical protein